MAQRVVGAAHMFPEGAAERQGQRAGVVSRTIAMVVDIVYVVAIAAVCYLGYAGFRFLRRPARFTWPVLSYETLVIVALVIAVVVLTIAWTGLGRTMGMRLMGLRIQSTRGSRLHLGRAFLRALACVVFPLGLFWSAVSKRNASIQDIVFRTSVVYDWESRVPGTRE